MISPKVYSKYRNINIYINRILASIQHTKILLLHKANDKKFFLNLEFIAVL